jgi:hypothetical protein
MKSNQSSQNNRSFDQEAEELPKANTGSNTSVTFGAERNSETPQSLGAAIAKGLGIEDQGVIDRGLALFKRYLDATTDYITSRPGEAVALAVVVGAAAWAAFATEPGKKALRSGKSVAWPQLSKWIHENLSAKKMH